MRPVSSRSWNSLIGAGVALALMAGFFAYQKWRYDSVRIQR
jgi:hypothetical protein